MGRDIGLAKVELRELWDRSIETDPSDTMHTALSIIASVDLEDRPTLLEWAIREFVTNLGVSPIKENTR